MSNQPTFFEFAAEVGLTNPAYRKFVKEVRENEITPANLEEYFGYGLYVGRK
ncbi:MAG: hypothetical protein HZB51_04500 [Chloroflexi bacterium]|nr:hypothetical protein [Chloroflexota bacterium]